MSESELPQVVPVEYAGKWVAWSGDTLRIVGVGDTPEQAKAAAERDGTTEIVYEWIPLADECFIGDPA
jgi:Family of unknown function (DUF5678)